MIEAKKYTFRPQMIEDKRRKTMYCTNCGRQNPDDAAFCAGCGEPMSKRSDELSNPIEPMTNSGFNQGYSYGGNAIDPAPDGRAQGVLEYIKTMLSSKLFLVLAILMSVSVALSIFVGVDMANGGAQRMFNELFENLQEEGMMNGMDQELIDQVMDSEAPQIGVQLPLMEIALLVGVWVLYADARNKNSLYVNTRGMTTIRVVALIALVFSSIGCGFIVLLMPLMPLFASVATEVIGDVGFAVMIWVFLLIAAAIAVFAIVYYALLHKSIKWIRNAMRCGIDSGKTSGFAAVMLIITGSIVALNSLSCMSYLFVPFWPMMLKSLASGAWRIIAGVMLLQYKNKMKVIALQ